MNSHWSLLNDKDRDAVKMLVAFLSGRLPEQQIIDWALRTKPHEVIKRTAVLQTLEFQDTKELKDPWRTAWRIIEEGWSQEQSLSSETDIYRAQLRLNAGERSGALISSIVAVVQPRLKLRSRSDQVATTLFKRPRRAADILHASLTSNKLNKIEFYCLDSIFEVDFLVALGLALEGAVNQGIAIGRRLGWEGDHKFWRLGQLHYVGYMVRNEDGYHLDVDEFHKGIAPSVKLLDAVVKRIAAIDPAKARDFVSRWKQMPTFIHLRLWASLSQNAKLTSATEVAGTLSTLEARPFWDLNSFPEIAELRAVRFMEIAQETGNRILSRIKMGPPRSFWPRDMDQARVSSAKRYWAARELRRIEIAGNHLPARASSWLAAYLHDSPELKSVDSIQFGFLASGAGEWVEPKPDDRFNDLVGYERLRALEKALGSSRNSWDDDPAERASDWIQIDDHPNLILNDFEAVPDGGADFPNTWDRFGWAHNYLPNGSEATPELQHVSDRVIALLELLPIETIEPAIQGITYWLLAWGHTVVQSQRLLTVWLKLWSVSVIATNKTTGEDEVSNLHQVVEDSAPDAEPSDLDTLNTAAGRLIGVFLMACPPVRRQEKPFEANASLRIMRDTIIADDGKSGFIGRHRMIEALPYFLKADESWARRHLVVPLTENDSQSLALWRAIARRTQFTQVLKEIGYGFAERATDRRIGREARSSLMSSLVLESLHALLDGREPVIANARVQQTLRAVEDEVRANAAKSVHRFLSWMAGNASSKPGHSAEDVFLLAIKPFLQTIWPQERSLATRGVAAAFAKLPAATGEEFNRTVGAVERFLVPFDCWSISELGLPREMGSLDSKFINTAIKAKAFLHLLDLCIGTAEGAVMPIDLTEALDQIRSVAGKLVQEPAFRRLETAARRR